MRPSVRDSVRSRLVARKGGRHSQEEGGSECHQGVKRGGADDGYVQRQNCGAGARSFQAGGFAKKRAGCQEEPKQTAGCKASKRLSVEQLAAYDVNDARQVGAMASSGRGSGERGERRCGRWLAQAIRRTKAYGMRIFRGSEKQ